MTTQTTEVVSSEDSGATPETYEQKVNTIISQAHRDDKGILKLPDGDIPEDVRYSANAELRRRNTESTLGKTSQQLKAEKAINQELQTRIAQSLQPELSVEEQAELEDLKIVDPDAWYKQKRVLETKASANLQSELGDIATKVSQQAETETKISTLEEFNAQHPDAKLTETSLAEDLPLRIVRQYEKGDMTYNQFLETAHNYLTAPKKVVGTVINETTNLNQVGGGSNPSLSEIGKDTSQSYKDVVF